MCAVTAAIRQPRVRRFGGHRYRLQRVVNAALVPQAAINHVVPFNDLAGPPLTLTTAPHATDHFQHARRSREV